MTVSRIEELSKSRSKIYIDGIFAFVLYKGELRVYGIKEEAQISREVYEEIVGKVLPKRAKLRAMNLLKGRRYTEKQLWDKLIQGLYPEDTVREAVDYVKSYRYIDDAAYARDYISFHREGKSRKAIEQELMRKGIEHQLVRLAMEELQDGDFSGEEKLVRRLLEKKHFDPETADMKERQRLFAYFYRKGFPLELVKKVMRDSFT